MLYSVIQGAEAPQKAKTDKHWLTNTSFSRGGSWDKLDPDINFNLESHNMAGGSEHNKHKISGKDRCFWRASNRKTHQKGHPPCPPISSWSPSNTVSVLTNYLKWPSERFPVHTHGQAQWLCPDRGLTDLSTECKTVNSFLLPVTFWSWSLSVFVHKFTLGHEHRPSRKGPL